jgi:CheY-like chemotaxis protein
VTPAEGVARPGIVYVDDSATAREYMRRALFRRGFALETFDSLAALQARSAGALVAALLDVDLGHGVTGLDVAREVRVRHPHAAIAFITASATPARIAELAPIGPVFRKDTDAARAADWLVTACTSSAAKASEGR